MADKKEETTTSGETAATPAAAPERGPRPSGIRIHVKNLCESATGEQLRGLFEPSGKVINAQVKTNDDGKCKGMGFVIMAGEDDANKAVAAVDGKKVDGKDLQVALGPGKGKGKDGKGDGQGKDGKGKGKGKDATGGGKGGKGDGKGDGKGGKGGKGAHAAADPMGQAHQMAAYNAAAAAAAAQYNPYAAMYGGYPGISPYGMPPLPYPYGMPGMSPYGYPTMPGMPPLGMPGQMPGFGFPGMQAPDPMQFAMPEPPVHAEKGKDKKGKGKGKGKDQGADNGKTKSNPPAADKQFLGTLKSVSAKNGYGFIDCSESMATWGRDVYVDYEFVQKAKVHEKLRFNIMLNGKGHPRAINVSH